jgi:uncharacterized phage protein (TIGR01671 family)
MRIIKFRAWDKRDKVMEQDVSTKPVISDWIFMQFTGLLDKNGNEIYEGDIVKCPMYNDSYKLEDCISSISWGYDGWEKGKLYHVGWNSLEIIGNIYEHPELLSDDLTGESKK